MFGRVPYRCTAVHLCPNYPATGEQAAGFNINNTKVY